jgi:hypothetical protein
MFCDRCGSGPGRFGMRPLSTSECPRTPNERIPSLGWGSLVFAGSQLIENLDGVVRDFDSENEPLRSDLKREGEERTARRFALGQSDDRADFGVRDKAELKSIR